MSLYEIEGSTSTSTVRSNEREEKEFFRVLSKYRKEGVNHFEINRYAIWMKVVSMDRNRRYGC